MSHGRDSEGITWLFLQVGGVLLLGVLVIRALLFGIYIKASCVLKLPYRGYTSQGLNQDLVSVILASWRRIRVELCWLPLNTSNGAYGILVKKS